MSLKDAKRFYADVNKNKHLYNAVRQTREMLVHLAKSHGYHFTYEELAKVLSQKWGADYERDNPNPDKPLTCTCF